jgi:type IV secretion system protein VirB4
LIKQGVNAVVARVDLSGMGDIINVLSGRSATITLLHELLEKHHHNPNKWLKIFYEQAKEVG